MDIKKLQNAYWTAREEYIRAEQEFTMYGGFNARSESDNAYYAMIKARDALLKAQGKEY